MPGVALDSLSNPVARLEKELPVLPSRLTKVDVGGPEAGATLEADRTLRDDGGIASGAH